MPQTTEEATETDNVLGARLRDIRRQQGMSLSDVEEHSGRDLHASVVGSYERGERSVSVERLRQLADFYRVPISELLPDPRQTNAANGTNPERLAVDLVALEQVKDRETALANYVEAIRSARGDYNGQVITLRADDLRALASTAGEDAAQMKSRFIAAGLVS